MKIEGVVGSQAVADGALVPARVDRFGAQVVSELSARYYEQAARGLTFTASNAASTSSAGLAATYTGGVCVSNPAGSGMNLVILKVSSACTVVTAAVTTAGVITGWAQAGITAHTTALTPVSNKLGSGIVPVAKADQATTLVGTPAWFLPGIASSGVAAGVWGATVDVEGSLVVTPGGYVATGTSVASPASAILASISWAEVAI